MKRIAIFCDGTWNKAGGANETNVVRLAEAVKARGVDDIPQMVIYAKGVGTGRGSSWIEAFSDGDLRTISSMSTGPWCFVTSRAMKFSFLAFRGGLTRQGRLSG